MITPIREMTINQIMKRKDDLLVSGDDINEIATNVRNKALDDFAEKLINSLDNNFRHLITTDSDGFDWITTDAVCTHINEVKKQLRG